MDVRPSPLALFAAALLLPGAALAQDYNTAEAPAYAAQDSTLGADSGGLPMAGGIGVGATSSPAPIGVRYWGNGYGLAAGIGLTISGGIEDETTDADDDEHTTVDWGLELSGMLPIYVGQSSVFYGAMTLTIDRDYAAGTNDDNDPIHSSRIGVQFGPWIGIEAFMGALGLPELSFIGQVGIPLTYTARPEDDGDRSNDWTFGTTSRGISLVGATVGFHYYFSL